jgi:hypothetical protein
MPNEQERPEFIKPEFLSKLKTLDPVTHLPQLKTPAVRVQQVMSETITPVDAKQKIAAAVRPPEKLVQYKDQTRAGRRVANLRSVRLDPRPAQAAGRAATCSECSGISCKGRSAGSPVLRSHPADSSR